LLCVETYVMNHWLRKLQGHATFCAFVQIHIYLYNDFFCFVSARLKVHFV